MKINTFDRAYKPFTNDKLYSNRTLRRKMIRLFYVTALPRSKDKRRQKLFEKMRSLPMRKVLSRSKSFLTWSDK